MTRSLRSLLAVVVLGALVALVGCGVPVDDEPRTFGLDRDLGDSPTSTRPPTDPEGTIYLVTTEENLDFLTPLPVEVAADRNDHEEYLRGLLDVLVTFQPEPTTDPDATSAQNRTIPLTVEDVEIDGTTAVLTFSGLEDLQSTSARLAIAQIVFTATEDPQVVDRVVFQRLNEDGTTEPVQVTVEGKTRLRGEPVTREVDFPTFYADSIGLEREPATTTTTAPPAEPPTEDGSPTTTAP